MKILSRLPIKEVFDYVLHTNNRFHVEGVGLVSVVRLRQFAIHGCKCVRCDRVGTEILITRDKGGGIHADLYTADEILMTRDHILPASKNGGNEVWNMRPMCQKCNTHRGNEYTAEDKKEFLKNHTWAKWHNRIWGRPRSGLTKKTFIPTRWKYFISKLFSNLG